MKRSTAIKVVIIIMIVFILTATGTALRIHNQLVFLWNILQESIDLAHEEWLDQDGVQRDQGAAYLVKNSDLIIQVLPGRRQGAGDSVVIRVFRQFNMRLESILVYSDEQWNSDAPLARAPNPLDLSQLLGLIVWHRIGSLTGASAQYELIVAPPSDALIVD